LKACSRALLVGACLLTLLGCSGPNGGTSSAGDEIFGLDVSGTIGTEPVVRMVTPLKVARSASEVVIAGTGAPVQIDQLFVLQLTLYDARSGHRVASTYAAGQLPLVAKSSDDSLFPALTKALIGKRQGSRIAVALTAADAYGAGGVAPAGVRRTDPIVVIADVVAVPPTRTIATADGTAVAPGLGTPRVTILAGDPTGVVAPTGPAPDALMVVPLLAGSGPKVRDHSLVTLDYLGQVWGSRGPFADTYFKEPVLIPVGATGSLPAWDQALVGVRRGSRLLIIDPNHSTSVPRVVTAPGRGTIAWVIDVLGVS
jgi:peptidylprolyl isomerase